jgi:c-di-GMP-binding flagellar brake protein YcgR
MACKQFCARRELSHHEAVTDTYPRKREHERYPIRISCEITLSGETLHAETRNLSTGGAAVSFSRNLTVGEVVTVSFFLTQDGIEDPDRSPFECAASVRWTKPEGKAFTAGLQFLSPSEEQRELLRDFIAQM